VAEETLKIGLLEPWGAVPVSGPATV